MYTMKTITEGLFNSVLLYCLPLFGGFDKGKIQATQVNSASADGCPRSLVCERLTLRSAPNYTSGIFPAHVSEGGG